MRSNSDALPVCSWSLHPLSLACLLAAAVLPRVYGAGPGACYTHCHVLWIQCDHACGGGSNYHGYDCTIACLEEKAQCFNTCLIAIHVAGLLFPAFPAGGVDSGGGGDEGTDVGGYASVAAAAASIRTELPDFKTRSRLGAGLNTDYSSVEITLGQADALLSTMGATRLQHSVYAKGMHEERLELVFTSDKSDIHLFASDVRGGSQHWPQGNLFSRRKAKHETENIQVSRFLGRWGEQGGPFRFIFDGNEERNVVQVSASDLLFGGEASQRGDCEYVSTRLTVRSLHDADFSSALLGLGEGDGTKRQNDKGSVCKGASVTIEAHFDGQVTRTWVFQGCSMLAYLPNAARAWSFGAAFDAVLDCHLVHMTSTVSAENKALRWFTAGTFQSTATVGGYTYSDVLPVRYTFPIFTKDPFNGIPGHTETDLKNSDPPSALVRAVEELEIRVNRLELS